jgi:hypothetical protein
MHSEQPQGRSATKRRFDGGVIEVEIAGNAVPSGAEWVTKPINHPADVEREDKVKKE